MFNQFYALVPSALDTELNLPEAETERQRLVHEAQAAGQDDSPADVIEMRKCA